ncbi:MAG TPA: hypothetical protein VIJ79_11775 [Acidobacteriaceae bacterium]
MRRHHILILCAALIAILPLLAFGCSCGHDIDFHLQSWFDAAQQFRHGTLLPHWTFSAAFNAGEPRFIFYPPLSWMFGALLTFLIPANLLPATYTVVCLAAAGFAMHRLASHFVPPNAALIATALYIANPYMLFNAFERTAYAELLAAAWLPLLFLAALRARPTVRGIALPVALLWLTNAPAAVMGCYTLAVIIAVRLAISLRLNGMDGLARVESAAGSFGRLRTGSSTAQLAKYASYSAQDDEFVEGAVKNPALKLALTSIAGTTLGLALPAVYLIPAAYERRFVQIAMAIIPSMRFEDNFIFGHTGDIEHDAVLHTASVAALILLIAATAAVLTLLLRKPPVSASRPQREARTTATCFLCVERSIPSTAVILTVLTLCISFLLIPASSPLWNHLPELVFLQFPWRLLSVLAVVLALTVALLLRNVALRNTVAIPLPLALVAALTFAGIHTYRQHCYPEDLPTTRAQQFATHHGVDPTDEYTPNNADNDVLRADDPPYWLSTDPAAFAPGTTPNPAATDPNYSGEPTDTASAEAPHHLRLTLAQPEILILNLRDYPNWEVTSGCPTCIAYMHFPHIQRDDGLIAIPLRAGDNTIDITWRRTLDQQIGRDLSIIALGAYVGLILRARSRRIVA